MVGYRSTKLSPQPALDIRGKLVCPCVSDLCPSASQFYYSKEPLFDAAQGFTGWIQLKNAPWAEVLDIFLLRAIESGIYIKNRRLFEHINLDEEDCLDTRKQVLFKYRLSYAAFPFSMLFAGYTIAAFVFLIERMWSLAASQA